MGVIRVTHCGMRQLHFSERVKFIFSSHLNGEYDFFVPNFELYSRNIHKFIGNLNVV